MRAAALVALLTAASVAAHASDSLGSHVGDYRASGLSTSGASGDLDMNQHSIVDTDTITCNAVTSGWDIYNAALTTCTGDTVCNDRDGLRGGQATTTTDPDGLMVRPQACSPSDGTCVAGNVNIFGGQDTTTITIDGADPSVTCAGDNDTVTPTVCNNANTCNATLLTEGTDWTATASVADTCASLAAAVDALAGVGATCTSPDVRITLDPSTGRVTLAESTGACTTVATGTAGFASFPLGTTGALRINGNGVTTQTIDLAPRGGVNNNVAFMDGASILNFQAARYDLGSGAGASSARITLTEGYVYASLVTLTAGTFNGNTIAYVRPVWTALAWTNAMLAACGAGTTCDITVATLPAKTLVKRALLVITTAATHAGTLTMAIGTAAGGTQYILASDIKAAASTVYGDAVAETGATLKDSGGTAWVDSLPSFTATQAVNARITSTVADVNTVTTSTGTLYLQTELLP